MARLAAADRKATVSPITTRYKTTLGATQHSAKNRKLRLQFAQAHQNWTIEDWKNVARSDES